MSTAQSPATAVAAAAAAVEKSKHWTAHGPALTVCLVSINLLMILLVFFYFWRFFSGKQGPSSIGGGADEEASSSSADTSPVTSPRASRRPDQLPVSVYDSSSDDATGGKAECAVCIVEFHDGDLARLLPRCGHLFHAACVDAWLRLHSTCPLCRADVVAPPPAAAVTKNDDTKDDGGAECPV